MLPSFLPHNSEAERLLGWKENRKHYWHGNSFDSFLGFISSRIEHQCQYKNPNSTWLSMTHNKALWTELLLRDTRWRQCLKAYTHSMFGQRPIPFLSRTTSPSESSLTSTNVWNIQPVVCALLPSHKKNHSSLIQLSLHRLLYNIPTIEGFPIFRPRFLRSKVTKAQNKRDCNFTRHHFVLSWVLWKNQAERVVLEYHRMY